MRKVALVLMTRNLRLRDNLVILTASRAGFVVLPVLMHPYAPNDRQSRSGVFITECLTFLKKECLARGIETAYCEDESTLDELISLYQAEAVYALREYTPQAIQTENRLRAVSEKNRAHFASVSDSLLTDPGMTVKPDGRPYQIFTPYYQKAREILPPLPDLSAPLFIPASERPQNGEEALGKLSDSPVQAALRVLKQLGQFQNYAQDRDFPALNATTGLSRHLMAGTVSVREVFLAVREKLGPAHPLIRQLYWRDFFTAVGWHFPHVFEGPFQKRYSHVNWNTSEKDFLTWCNGMTGFPLVDAGMRELRETGLMHNRVRMIAASFLVKDLKISWQKGEEYFAKTLLDFDQSVNNGNWQWAASCGCDAVPYFRVFNPQLQQARYDSHAEYVRRWVPELGGLSAKEILGLYTKRQGIPGRYPAPMVDHNREAASFKAMMKN